MVALPAPVLSALLQIRLGDGSLEGTLTRMCEIARDALEGADEVSITLIRDDEQWTAAYSGQLALDGDERQYERGYGPCIDAGVSGTVLICTDMREETRWPDYAADVIPKGILASLSIPLPLQTDLVGGLNCYSRTPGAIGDVDLAVELAGHVAVPLANAFLHTQTAEYADQMKQAMASRAVIEQAKGVIMAQNRCGEEQAFEVLRRASMGRNVKLRDLAQGLVDRLNSAS